ncbi:TM2 domain-containing protein 3 [Fragariocoptes setiger]|uniref:TM2 domain-containing protein 3 n=1 Tax=Fragariocoptes setiger TaxID=1670756 RepID=A0ABQ7S752_9ACAR|nr:TM2 domain-containing protein 3 [Fragariocoptes setiger]
MILCKARNSYTCLTILLITIANAWASTSPPLSCAPDFPGADEQNNSCSKLKPGCVKCDFNSTCVYGQPNTVRCHVTEDIPCKGDRSFDITFTCLYCWQLPENSYSCLPNTTCRINTRYLTMCSVNSTTYCLGSRIFPRYKRCNFSTNYKWSSTILLSILGGGFGLDRFYLGHWQEGIGKLFSFGGFGLWTLVDSILIWLQYLKPADTSHYIDD